MGAPRDKFSSLVTCVRLILPRNFLTELGSSEHGLWAKRSL